ncbi:uncharacterized protein LOC124665585 [Lolium rigidum]|uniref:uncharacterized protein LOC124665585 n=1 Tax=Lolium rigidum TaxID=89674 RepID=UPI001F5CACE3|nr:uncharacterized protein LOC124665585 [Lolium rigidum]
MGSGNKSSHDFEEEQLTPEYSHDTASESPKSTHYTNKRPYDGIVEDDYLDVPAVGSSDSPTEPDTWVKRPRFGKIPDFRTAKNGRKSTLELKMRKFGNRNSDEVVAPEPGMEFDSLPEAFDFFNLYSWEVGFGIRYGASRKNKQGSMTMQEILCGCASHSKLQ